MRRPAVSLRTRLGLERLEDRHTPSATTAFLATDLASDQPGVAAVTDPTLRNAWGLALNGGNGAFWISANGAGLSEVYTLNATTGALGQPFKVTIPGGAPTSAPTGQVFNGSATDFLITPGNAAAFVFASEDGTITAWNPRVGVPAGGKPPSTVAETEFTATDGAVFKGLALAKVGNTSFLFATDFHNGKIDVFDNKFAPVTLGAKGFGTFTDPNLPKGYAPFGISAINGLLYVTYAKQNAERHDDVAGQGHGFVDVFDTSGNLKMRFASKDDLNSPWAVVQAPAGFGQFGGDILVGNFGDGMIHAFNPTTGKDLGTLGESKGHPLVIDGLWGLAFGIGKVGADTNTLYFTAGPDHEAHGEFGKITANPEGTNPVTATLSGSDLVITGSRDNDQVSVGLDRHTNQLVVTAGGQVIGQFDPAAVGVIHFNGFAGDDTFTVDRRVTNTVVADGGAGNDVLTAGGGSAVLSGGIGDDVLIGGSGRDILVGGAGSDRLFGQGGDDILIGGQTAADTNPAAFLTALDAWNSSQSYNARVAALRTTSGGVLSVGGIAVSDDGVRDDLFGGSGLDWFVGDLPDVLHGRQPNEQIN